MEKTNITYSEWPDSVKIMSAFYFKPIMAYIKNPTSVRNLSFLSFAVGILVILEPFLLQRAFDAPLMSRMNLFLFFGGALNILLGAFNLFFNYKVHLWVNEHSSWEERFAHKSSGKHQFQYLLVWLLIIGLSILLTYIIQSLI